MTPLNTRVPPRKRPSSAFVSPLSSSKTTKFDHPQTQVTKSQHQKQHDSTTIDFMVSLLADAGCTLINPIGPPCLPSDPTKLRHRLQHMFSGDSCLPRRSKFLSAFSDYIQSPSNFHRVLIPSGCDGSISGSSLVRNLLLVPSIQLDLQIMLLEKLPEYFDTNLECSGTNSFVNDISTLIICQYRWLDFLVDSNAFAEKLLEVLSICPIHLRKEIIGSLPDILGDQNNKAVVDFLEQMLQEDSAIIVTVLDSLSNLNLNDQLQEQVITVALSCIRTIDAEHMPYLLRFLLLSALPSNARRIISNIRVQLKFVGVSNYRGAQKNKLKGKLLSDNYEATMLDSLRSCIRYKNVLSEEILKELKSFEKTSDHRVIDIWLLVLIYMNGDSLQKNVEKMLKKKVIDGCIREDLFDQCIQGNGALVQDYFPSFCSLSAYLLACKEQRAREFGTHMYVCLFEELIDTYSRQEVLGALVTHIGSGISLEVGSALETMIMLTSKYSQEMVQFSSHINGILDYLEGFTIENLHKVYDIFCRLALRTPSASGSFGSSIVNELFMIVRKQISSPDMKYKKMGIIGTLMIVSCLGDVSNVPNLPFFQKSKSDEALDLLEACLECCKQLPILWILFYDELIAVLESRTLQQTIMEWIGRHVGEFESLFIVDLEQGNIPTKEFYCDLEGDLWMNLDGDISPICVNILPIVSSSLRSSSLKILPANFLLLSVLERLGNQGSLTGIDALLGCPLHLPSFKYFSRSGWRFLAAKQKQIVCLSVYYATNWIRELINAFCTQVKCDCTSQASKDEITEKLLKRLRNLVFLESLLNNFLQECPLSLPDLKFHEQFVSSFIDQPVYIGSMGRMNEHVDIHERKSLNKKRKQNKKTSENCDMDGKFKQTTILEMFRKARGVNNQNVSNEDSSDNCSNVASETVVRHSCNLTTTSIVEVSAIAKILEAQRFKFRPLLIECLIILTFSKNNDFCCLDPSAELPLHLYIMRDLHYKLEFFVPTSKQIPARGWSIPSGFKKMTVNKFMSEVRPLFPSLRKHFNAAVLTFKQGTEVCQEHWKVQSYLANNPDIPELMLSRSSVSIAIYEEILYCFSKMVSIPDLIMNKSVFSDLLQAFQPVTVPTYFFNNIKLSPTPGNMDYLYCSAYCFLEENKELASIFSFELASEVLLTLESLVNAGQQFFEKSLQEDGKTIHEGFIKKSFQSYVTDWVFLLINYCFLIAMTVLRTA